ncbi:hypothetical protein PSHT_09839 [Puccinia striiformis]|uniref:Uncharacterized protein n=1 Tax=Puccinia striiformis TaxID=27350 RepID=A0A2S4VE01_9BASI|nr:hypothetical protein PSHT_09839 [Puccinia striiformis]
MAAKLHSLIGFDAANCMLGCMPHVINLAAKVGIEAFSGKFATDLKQSSQKATEFSGIVKALGKKDIGMIGDVATQWNSTFKMLERAYKIQEPSKSSAADSI